MIGYVKFPETIKFRRIYQNLPVYQFSCTNEAGEELSYLDVNTDEFWFLHKTFGPMNKSLEGNSSKQSYALLDV